MSASDSVLIGSTGAGFWVWIDWCPFCGLRGGFHDEALHRAREHAVPGKLAYRKDEFGVWRNSGGRPLPHVREGDGG